MFLRYRWILTKPQPFFNNSPSPSSSIARFSKMEDVGEDRPKPQTTTTTGDIMEDSFGHGYSTRSDDDGFGGIYGGGNHNKSLGEKSVAEEDDAKKQGSQVKQREKGQ